MKYEYNYPMPAVTADIIVVRGDWDEEREVLLVKRAKDPFKDHWSFPGGHFDVNTDASVLDCALRELKEETQIEAVKEFMELLGHFDEMNRDPRGRYVTFVYVYDTTDYKVDVEAADDVDDHQWVPFGKIKDISLAFDHRKIFDHFLAHFEDLGFCVKCGKICENWTDEENLLCDNCDTEGAIIAAQEEV